MYVCVCSEKRSGITVWNDFDVSSTLATSVRSTWHFWLVQSWTCVAVDALAGFSLLLLLPFFSIIVIAPLIDWVHDDYVLLFGFCCRIHEVPFPVYRSLETLELHAPSGQFLTCVWCHRKLFVDGQAFSKSGFWSQHHSPCYYGQAFDFFESVLGIDPPWISWDRSHPTDLWRGVAHRLW